MVELPHSDKNAFFRSPDFSVGPSDVLPKPITLDHVENVLDTPSIEKDFDIWALAEEVPIKAANYQSWDSFEEKPFGAEYSPYITEAGPLIFEAAVQGPHDYLHVGNAGYAVVDTKLYAASVFSLGLGRSSVLFKWDEEKRSFKPALPRMRIMGYTGEILDGLLAVFMDCGNITKSLQSFVDKAYMTRKSPGQVALADAVSTLLTTIQSCLSESCSQYQSILQLQILFNPAHSILNCFQRIVKDTSRTRSDESMLSTIFEEIQLQEHRTDLLKDILIEIFSKASRPWLEFVGEWIGLRREEGIPITKEGQGKSFIQVTDKEWVDEQGLEIQQRDFVLDYDKVPSFIAPEDARSMFEVGKSLRFLRAHHSHHPLSRADIIASANPPVFEWKFSWQDIMAVECKALQYEKDLTDAIETFSNGSLTLDPSHASEAPVYKWDFFGKPEEDMQAHFLSSIDAFNLPLQKDIAPDQLSVVLRKFLS